MFDAFHEQDYASCSFISGTVAVIGCKSASNLGSDAILVQFVHSAPISLA